MRRRSIICAAAARACILNCGYGHGYSVLELLDAVQKRLRPHARHPRPRAPRRRRAGDDRRRPTASSETLAWEPRYDDIETIVAHALSWEEQLQKKLAA